MDDAKKGKYFPQISIFTVIDPCKKKPENFSLQHFLSSTKEEKAEKLFLSSLSKGKRKERKIAWFEGEKWRLFNVKFSIIYWILLHYALYSRRIHTRNSHQVAREQRKMENNKRIHFAQSRIKFLLNFRTFTFIHPPPFLKKIGKFIDWCIVNLELSETFELEKRKNPFFKSKAASKNPKY